MKMRDLLSIERVIPRLSARNRRDALRSLAACAAQDAGVSPATVARSVQKGAAVPAFASQAGVSLFHAFVPGLGRPVATFARLKPAIRFGAADGAPTDLVALLLSPAESTADHLRALARIARTLRDSAVRSLLRAAEGRDSLYRILCGGEQHQPHEPVPGLKRPSQYTYRQWWRERNRNPGGSRRGSGFAR